MTRHAAPRPVRLEPLCPGPARAAVRKKGAAPAGGESGGRVTGPARGGEAGSVLSESLSAFGARIDYEPRIQRQPMELQHMPHTYEQVYRPMSMLLDHFFHGVRQFR